MVIVYIHIYLFIPAAEAYGFQLRKKNWNQYTRFWIWDTTDNHYSKFKNKRKSKRKPVSNLIESNMSVSSSSSYLFEAGDFVGAALFALAAASSVLSLRYFTNNTSSTVSVADSRMPKTYGTNANIDSNPAAYLSLIGNTPLVMLPKLSKAIGREIWVKVNPNHLITFIIIIYLPSIIVYRWCHFLYF